MFTLNDLRLIILTVVYAGLGFALLMAAYFVFDWVTPRNMQQEIFDKGNVAASVIAGFFVLAIAIVIHAAVHG